MKKVRFLTIKKRHCVILLILLLCFAIFCATYFPIKASTVPKPVHTIVIDAGHGGKDGGAVGKNTDVTESSLNLKYAQKLQELCRCYGFEVVMTRSDMNGLYSPFASNKKRSEMEKRKEIIESADADVVVSLHMNSFPSINARGAQVYYAHSSESGKVLADTVQKQLHKEIDYAKGLAKEGDFYILNCTSTPSILVECGFLSNAEEEVLLQDNEYIEKFCYHLLCGILLYFR